MTRKASPPGHLGNEMKSFWRRVNRDYSLEPEHLRILQLACESYDLSQMARRQIAVAGLVTQDGKRHPAAGIQSKATEVFYRGIKELGLGLEVASEPKS